MLKKKSRAGIVIINVFLFLACILLFGSSGIDLSIKHAYPFILLSLLTAFSAFSKIPLAAAAGFISGAFIDSIASGSYCFNTLALMLLSVAVCLLSNTVFNKNLKAVVTLCFLAASVYYFFYWLVFINPDLKIRDDIEYLLQYALPSAIYTTVFVFPFFFLYRHWDKLRTD